MDAEYGIAPYKFDTPAWANVAFTRMEVERLQSAYPEVQKNRNRFLSIGAVRMARMIPVIDRPTSPDAPSVVRASDRHQIDNFLAVLQQRVRESGTYRLWFRGQPDDYLTEDFISEARAGICAWRSTRDSSLVPSLYRELPKRLNNPRAYAEYCFEYALYSTFMEVDLNLATYRVRNTADAPQERLSGSWAQRVFKPTFVTRKDGSVEMYYRPLSEHVLSGAEQIRDYDPVFFGLQKIFFMQHYGLHSNVLDLTHDIDVALFFAQNEFIGHSIRPVDFAKHQPVLYLFLLRDDLDMVLDSEILSEHYGLLRPQRQKCGLLFGASFVHRNDYARFIALKIILEKPIEYTADAADLIPPPEEDRLLARLIDFADRNQLSQIRPWVYA